VQIDKKYNAVYATHVPSQLKKFNLNSVGLIIYISEPKKNCFMHETRQSRVL